MHMIYMDSSTEFLESYSYKAFSKFNELKCGLVVGQNSIIQFVYSVKILQLFKKVLRSSYTVLPFLSDVLVEF